ncbi:F-box protein [Aspergillus thermomutatus]|uniref:F-box domain-containing protein n=1 Tax=Aspergillus thermomutatus TaxID=41047 RepID=A0A397FZ71_ASPTH|nr:uncharacterized protein CDV56_100113 [Aspergillus thermomutatus]RHZ43837.1 hypothetical protein CDV56_100113 [Aspergillus thermomutatus]
MMSLQSLPAEVTLQIFQLLDNIDDALRLGRSCRQLYRILDRPGHRHMIMKSIIQRSEYHKYDLQLSHLTQFHAECAKIYATQPRLPMSRRPDTDMVKSFHEPSKELLASPLAVAEIVTRWHAMKALFDLYCKKSVRSSYMANWETSWNCFTETDGENETAGPSTQSICDSFAQLPLQEKQRAYERFYRALTAHWVAVELTWVIRVSKHKTERDFKRWERTVYNRWSNNPQRSLEEKLDIFEILDFVWFFLVSKIFDHSGTVADWIEVALESATPRDLSPLDLYLSHIEGSGHPAQLGTDHPDVLADDYTGWFIDDLTSIIRPPHVIELLLRLAWDPKSQSDFDRPEYVRKLGLLDQSYRWEQTKADGFRTYDVELYTIDLPDTDILLSLYDMAFRVQDEELWDLITKKYRWPDSEIDEQELNSECAEQWEWDKENLWNTDMRGEIFFRQETQTELFERLIQLEGLYIMGEGLVFDPLDPEGLYLMAD